jgi:hypothetical protein
MRFTHAAEIPGAIPCGERVMSIARWFGHLVARRATGALDDWAAASPNGGEWTAYQTDMLADILAASDWFASRKARILNLFRHVERCSAFAERFGQTAAVADHLLIRERRPSSCLR